MIWIGKYGDVAENYLHNTHIIDQIMIYVHDTSVWQGYSHVLNWVCNRVQEGWWAVRNSLWTHHHCARFKLLTIKLRNVGHFSLKMWHGTPEVQVSFSSMWSPLPPETHLPACYIPELMLLKSKAHTRNFNVTLLHFPHILLNFLTVCDQLTWCKPTNGRCNVFN